MEYLDDAVELAIKEQELAGIDVITDGEQRRASFVAFVGQKIPGFKLVHITKLNPNAKDIMRRLKAQLTYWRAVAVDRLHDSVLARDEFEFANRFARGPLKVTLPSPYLVMWETWHEETSKSSYPRPEDLAEDFVKILRAEVIRLRDAGAQFVQFDEPMLGDLTEASSQEPDRYRKLVEAIHGQKYRGFKDELALARDLVNETIKGITGLKLGMHMDRWPIKDSPYYGVGYERLLPDVLDIKVEQLVLEYASLGSGDPAKFVEHLPSNVEVGLGVIDVRNPTVEQPSEIVQRVEPLLKHRSADKVWLNPDCGFAPGMYRGFPRGVAAKKLKAMVTAAQMLRAKYA